MNIEQARFNMIEQQIRTWDVLDGSVLSLLAAVKREDFVPETYKALAFVDTEVPLPDGQFMLAPKVEARLLQELAIDQQAAVLEVGAGSGFMAALLAHRARQVITLEIDEKLAALARSNLQRAGIDNVAVRHMDGSRGLPGEAPSAAFLLPGRVPEVPPTLPAQWRVGGRPAAIVGQEPVMRATLFTRSAEHGFSSVELFDTVAPRLRNFGEPSRFRF